MNYFKQHKNNNRTLLNWTTTRPVSWFKTKIKQTKTIYLPEHSEINDLLWCCLKSLLDLLIFLWLTVVLFLGSCAVCCKDAQLWILPIIMNSLLTPQDIHTFRHRHRPVFLQMSSHSVAYITQSLRTKSKKSPSTRFWRDTQKSIWINNPHQLCISKIFRYSQMIFKFDIFFTL